MSHECLAFESVRSNVISRGKEGRTRQKSFELEIRWMHIWMRSYLSLSERKQRPTSFAPTFPKFSPSCLLAKRQKKCEWKTSRFLERKNCVSKVSNCTGPEIQSREGSEEEQKWRKWKGSCWLRQKLRQNTKLLCFSNEEINGSFGNCSRNQGNVAHPTAQKERDSRLMKNKKGTL